MERDAVVLMPAQERAALRAELLELIPRFRILENTVWDLGDHQAAARAHNYRYRYSTALKLVEGGLRIADATCRGTGTAAGGRFVHFECRTVSGSSRSPPSTSCTGTRTRVPALVEREPRCTARTRRGSPSTRPDAPRSRTGRRESDEPLTPPRRSLRRSAARRPLVRVDRRLVRPRSVARVTFESRCAHDAATGRPYAPLTMGHREEEQGHEAQHHRSRHRGALLVAPSVASAASAPRVRSQVVDSQLVRSQLVGSQLVRSQPVRIPAGRGRQRSR